MLPVGQLPDRIEYRTYSRDSDQGCTKEQHPSEIEVLVDGPTHDGTDYRSNRQQYLMDQHAFRTVYASRSPMENAEGVDSRKQHAEQQEKDRVHPE